MEQLNTIRRPVRRVDISINMEKTGANIRSLIKSSGYSVRDIMAITGISTEQAVYKWYRGESIPSIETMLILCGTLGVDVKELLVIDGDFAFLRFHFACDLRMLVHFGSEAGLVYQHLKQTGTPSSCAAGKS